ncbi:MAG: hypothetical protein JNM80_01155 [Phycisphaerae bacterium]|nr:hypothetical protein [Phycisphaerae bacterium]
MGTDKGSASRLLKAMRSRDPIAVVHLIPGPEPLRRLLRAARDRGVSEALIVAGEKSTDEFESLVRSAAGDRVRFDGILSTLLPEARVQNERRLKQLLYRGQSQLKGYSVDVDFTAIFIHPAPSETELEYGVVSGMLGVRRFRPNAVVRLVARRISDEHLPWQGTTLQGKPIDHTVVGRLDQFCTAPTAEVVVEEAGDSVSTVLAGSAYGPSHAVDLVLGHRSRLPAARYNVDGGRSLSGAGVEVDKPTKLLHLDVFVHTDVYAGADPGLVIVDTAFRGMANINDPRRVPDRVDLIERVDSLGRGLGRVRASHIACYAEMLHHVVGSCGWNPDQFRGYRCLMQHPVYGTQVTMGFVRPQKRV